MSFYLAFSFIRFLSIILSVIILVFVIIFLVLMYDFQLADLLSNNILIQYSILYSQF